MKTNEYTTKDIILSIRHIFNDESFTYAHAKDFPTLIKPEKDGIRKTRRRYSREQVIMLLSYYYLKTLGIKTATLHHYLPQPGKYTMKISEIVSIDIKELTDYIDRELASFDIELYNLNKNKGG